MINNANLYRRSRSLLGALRGKVVGVGGRAQPVSSCQVPDLKNILTKSLGNMGSGTFVEVGAFDGERFSNTSWLADNGWKGLYVEPSADFSRLCAIRHRFNNVSVANCAIGEKEGSLSFSQMGALSTLSEDALEVYSDSDWSKRALDARLETQTVSVHPLDQILSKYNIDAGFDILVVDVEGFEEQVFAGFSIDKWTPKVMIVELVDLHPDFQEVDGIAQSSARVRQKIIAAGYREIFSDAINTVFEREGA